MSSASVARTIGEASHWRIRLNRQPTWARGFHAVSAVATLLGPGLTFFSFDPIRGPSWSTGMPFGLRGQ